MGALVIADTAFGSQHKRWIPRVNAFVLRVYLIHGYRVSSWKALVGPGQKIPAGIVRIHRAEHRV